VRLAKVIVWDEEASKSTVPVPAAQFADVLLLDHDPPNVQVPLPILKYAVALEMSTFPAMLTTDAAPEPSRTAVPKTVRLPPAVRPLLEEAPIVMIPVACTMSPLTAKSKVPIAIVPAQPVVFKEAMPAFWPTVTVPPPEFASKNTGLDGVGTAHPPKPPDEGAQWKVWDQLPEPSIQYRSLPHGERTRTSTTGSEPSIVKVAWPEASTIPFMNTPASFVTLNR
jgi:hypothetical protein